MDYGASVRNKNIIVTGGLGFIGSNLARHCLDLGAKHVFIYDSMDARFGGNLFNISDFGDRSTFVKDTILNSTVLGQYVSQSDVIFNCAAFSSHTDSMKFPFDNIEINCKGVLNILEVSRKMNPKIKIVHVGTSTQIGKMQSSIIDETHAEFPLDIYSANKVAAEKYVLIYQNTYDLDATVVRLSNVFGPRANIRNPEFGFINFFIGLALQKKTMTIFGKGEQVRNVIYVQDAVEALIAAADSSKAKGEVFFAVSDEHFSVAEIAQKIATIVGGELKICDWPEDRKSIDVGNVKFSNKKIKSVLNWHPRVSLENGLNFTKSFYLENLSKYLG